MYGVELDDQNIDGEGGPLQKEDEKLLEHLFQFEHLTLKIQQSIRSVGQNTIKMIVSAHEEPQVPGSKRFSQKQKDILNEIF